MFSRKMKYASFLTAAFLITAIFASSKSHAVESDKFCFVNSTGLFAPCPTDSTNHEIVTINPGTPSNVTPVNSTNSGTTGSVSSALSGAAGKTTFLCGFEADAQATAATSGTLAINGTAGGTINFLQPVAVAPAVGSVKVTFTPCIAGGGLNTAIQIVTFAPGAGGVTQLSLWGYQQQ
jgi:hypothetical protein